MHATCMLLGDFPLSQILTKQALIWYASIYNILEWRATYSCYASQDSSTLFITLK